MTKKKYAIFFTEQIKNIKQKDGYIKEVYTMLRVQIFNNNIDEADQKCRTIADKLKLKLAGGFTSRVKKYYKEYSFGKIIDVFANTKIQPYNDHDRFIIDLIEREKNMQYIIL